MISIYLLVLFKASLDQVCLPLDWFCGNVVVHKDGSKLLSTNYSSISLISICCKLLEHVISSYITSFLEMHSILVYFQHGPRSGYQLQLHFFQSCMASWLPSMRENRLLQCFETYPRRSIGTSSYLVKKVAACRHCPCLVMDCWISEEQNAVCRDKWL